MEREEDGKGREEEGKVERGGEGRGRVPPLSWILDTPLQAVNIDVKDTFTTKRLSLMTQTAAHRRKPRLANGSLTAVNMYALNTAACK